MKYTIENWTPTVIIPTYNCLEYLKLALKSVYNTSLHNFQVVVVIDGSTDDTLEWMEDNAYKYDNLKVITCKHNQGVCTAYNLGAYAADNEWIILCNDDFVFCKNWELGYLETLNQELNDDNDKFMISPTFIEPGVLPAHPSFHVVNCGTDYKEFDLDKFNDTVTKLRKTYTEEGCNGGHCLLKKYYMITGGNDPRFNKGPLSDPDWYMRLTMLGFRYVRTANSIVYHFSGKATRFANESKTVNEAYTENEKKAYRLWKAKWGFEPTADPVGFMVVLPNKTVSGIDWTKFQRGKI